MARRRALDVCETWHEAGGGGGRQHAPLRAAAAGVTTGVTTGVATTHNPRSTRFTRFTRFTRDAQGFYEAALNLDPGHVPTLVRYGQ